MLIRWRSDRVRDHATDSGVVRENLKELPSPVPPRTLESEGRRGKLADTLNKSSKRENPDLGNGGANILEAVINIAKEVDRVGLDLTRMSDEEEQKLGALINKEILKKETILSEPALQKRVLNIMFTLIAHCKRKRIQYTLQIIDSSEVNAFSVAGGYVYLTRGFVKRFTSDAALAMALGHEIGHVDLRHCVEKIQYYSLGQQVLGELTSFAQFGYQTLRTAYTKGQEFEADRFGFQAGSKTGVTRQAMIEFLENLDAYEKTAGKQFRAASGNAKSTDEQGIADRCFATHPSTAERISKLKSIKD